MESRWDLRRPHRFASGISWVQGIPQQPALRRTLEACCRSAPVFVSVPVPGSDSVSVCASTSASVSVSVCATTSASVFVSVCLCVCLCVSVSGSASGSASGAVPPNSRRVLLQASVCIAIGATIVCLSPIWVVWFDLDSEAIALMYEVMPLAAVWWLAIAVCSLCNVYCTDAFMVHIHILPRPFHLWIHGVGMLRWPAQQPPSTSTSLSLSLPLSLSLSLLARARALFSSF